MSVDNVPDERLVARIAAGDIEALAALFRLHQQHVYRFALHLTGSPAAADDVTQDVFVAVIGGACRFDPARGAVVAWLCGMARNFVRRRFVLDRHTSSIDGDETLQATLAAVTEDPFGDLTAARQVDALRRAVLSLPMRYREVVVLCDLQEMSYADAAAALECPVGTVRSRLNRGRTLLAAKIQAEKRAADGSTAQGRGITRCLA